MLVKFIATGGYPQFRYEEIVEFEEGTTKEEITKACYNWYWDYFCYNFSNNYWFEIIEDIKRS